MHRPTRARLRACTLAGIAATAALTLLGCGVGSSGGTTISRGSTAASRAAESATPTGTPTVNVGTSLDVTTDTYSGTYTVSKVEIRNGKNGRPALDDLGMPSSKGTWVLAYITVEITTADTMVCSCDWTLVTASHTVYDSSYGSFTGHDDFQSLDLNAGQNTSGWLTFDVPPTAVKGATLQLKVSAFFNAPAYGYWRL